MNYREAKDFAVLRNVDKTQEPQLPFVGLAVIIKTFLIE